MLDSGDRGHLPGASLRPGSPRGRSARDVIAGVRSPSAYGPISAAGCERGPLLTVIVRAAHTAYRRWPHSIRPREITAPTLLVHGTKDAFVSVEDSRAAAPLLVAEHRLVEIEGSQHGFAVHDDPQYLNPQSQAWQALVIETVAEWITASS